MNFPLIELAEWIRTTPDSWTLLFPLLFGIIYPRWGFVCVLMWFCLAWWFA